jgi:hypothetical protein
MLRGQHVRMQQLRGAIVAGAGVGLFLAACQGPDEYYRGHDLGQAGIGVPGAGGNSSSGVAGTTGAAGSGVAGSGVAGSVFSGAAGNASSGAAGSVNTGSAGNGAGGSAAGAAGATGAGGTTGGGGRGGATGTGGSGGSTGRGGTGGAGGSGGRGGSGGSAGSTGRGGSGGNAGSTGSGGRAGAAGGATGTGGAAGANNCPLGGRLDCTTAGSLDLPGGQVVDFSAAQWNNTTNKWCNADGLDGGISSFAGTGSTAAVDVDTTARNFTLNVMVSAGQYAGGRVNFDSCVDARAYNSIQFTASVTGGSLNGCVWQLQLQTQDQRPTTATNPTGGTCATNCERYPVATLTAATATATMYTTRFTAFSNPAMSTVATASQLTGIQWQVNSSNNGSCTVELTIDNVRFVTQ